MNKQNFDLTFLGNLFIKCLKTPELPSFPDPSPNNFAPPIYNSWLRPCTLQYHCSLIYNDIIGILSNLARYRNVFIYICTCIYIVNCKSICIISRQKTGNKNWTLVTTVSYQPYEHLYLLNNMETKDIAFLSKLICQNTSTCTYKRTF